MEIAPFATEQYFALYEFSTPHLLSVSDCETISIGELLALGGQSLDDLADLRLGYTHSQGNQNLRTAVAGAYNQVSTEEVIVLGSPVEGIYLTMQTLLEPGDEVIVLLPAYDALKNVADHVAGQVHPWFLAPTASRWQLDLDALDQLINDKTRLIIVNFPHNPTGFLPDLTEFESLISLVQQKGIWLYCDEMYRGLEDSKEQRLPSAADLYERAIVLAGLSKTQGLPGLRSGWLIVKDEQTRDKLINWKHYTSICPPAPSEYLAMAALKADKELSNRNRAIIRENLELAEPFFERWGDLFTWRRPQAGSVALVGINVDSATAYCHSLAAEAGVLLLPSTFMGYDDKHVRFGFGRKSFPQALECYEVHLQISAKGIK